MNMAMTLDLITDHRMEVQIPRFVPLQLISVTQLRLCGTAASEITSGSLKSASFSLLRSGLQMSAYSSITATG